MAFADLWPLIAPVNDSGETLDLTDWKTAAADVAELVDGFVGNAALASANFASCHKFVFPNAFSFNPSPCNLY